MNGCLGLVSAGARSLVDVLSILGLTKSTDKPAACPKHCQLFLQLAPLSRLNCDCG